MTVSELKMSEPEQQKVFVWSKTDWHVLKELIEERELVCCSCTLKELLEDPDVQDKMIKKE